MKRYLVIFIIAYLFPIFGHSTTGQQIYIYPITYTITKDVVVYSSNSYALGEVMVGINNGWTNGNASGNVTINRTIKYNNYQYTVGRLGKWAFKENTQMTSITIPNTIRTIEEESFLRCSSLRNVTITPYPDYNSISSNAFQDCESLESVVFDGSTLYVGESAFSGCKNLQSFPFEKVPSISKSSFAGCKALLDITLNMNKIGENAFINCTSLSSVTFTNEKLDIGKKAFYGCEKLRTVTSFMTKENFTSLPSDNCFSGISSKAVLYVLNGMVSDYENDANWHAAFPNIKAIAPSLGETFSVDIPINNGSLKLTFEVTDVENMEAIITSCECEIYSPKDLVLPSEISYHDWHFSIVGISTSAFTNIQNIHSVEVGWRQPFDATNNFCNLPDDAILYVPAGTKHRYEAFESWQMFSDIIELSPISLGDASSLVGSNVVIPIILNNNTEVVEGVQFRLTLPNGVSIKEENGELKTSLTQRTEGMTTMGRKDPDSVNSYMFLLFSLNGNPITGNEGAIMNVDLEIDSDAEIGKKDMIIEDIHLTTSTFSTLYPATASSELQIYTNIRNIDFADAKVKALCVSQWDLNDDEELDTSEATAVKSLGGIFTGNGDITSFDELQYFTGISTISLHEFNHCNNLTTVVIPSNVTIIEKGAFDGCYSLSSIVVDEENTNYDSRAYCNAIIESNTNTLVYGCMNTVIPNSVNVIGRQAFKNCSGLTTLDIPSSVTIIEEEAFSGCNSLSTLEIPNSVITIGEGAFAGCNSLTALEIPNCVTTIGEGAFAECNSLITLSISNSVANIGEGAFYNCSGLITIVVDENNTSYDSRENCNAIIETETNKLVLGCVNSFIPNGIATIGNDAFMNNKELTKIIIPQSVTSIGENAFSGCKLTIVKLKNTMPIDIHENVFSNRSKATLYVPMGCIDDYMTSNYWNEFKALKAYPDGDVNQDGEIDVVDVVDIARFVVGTKRDRFDEYIADMNNDDIVNVADAVSLVNFIAGDTNFARSSRYVDMKDDALSLIQNTDRSLSLELESNRQYTAFQFDLTLPEDIEVIKISLNSQRKQKHQLLYNKVSNGKYRVTALSTSNRVFIGTSGELINIAIDGKISGDIMIDNIHFVTAQGHDIPFNSIYLDDSSTTGIDCLNDNTVRYLQRSYNINGQRIAVPQKGINIVGGKKVLVK